MERRVARRGGKYGADSRIEEHGERIEGLGNRRGTRQRELQDDGWRAGSDTGTGTHYSR